MKLYTVSARWLPKGMRKRRGAIGCVIAETKEEAIEKFKQVATYPSDLYVEFSAYEEEKGAVVMHYS